MKKASFLSYILLNLTTVFLQATHLDSKISPSDSLNETPSKIVIRYRGNRGIGYEKGYTTIGAFLTPNWNSNFQPYADIRAHLMAHKKLATNIGIGARGAPVEGFAIGGNFFFDYRHVSSMPCYQLGSGLELISPYLDFRLNGYLPVGRKMHTYEPDIRHFEGNKMVLKQSTKMALASICAEFGVWIPKLPEVFQLYLAAGPYYLGSRHMKTSDALLKKVGDTCGGKCRLTARIFQYLDGGIEYTYDALFNGRFQGYVSLSIPLGQSKMYRLFKKQGYKHLSDASIKFKRQMVQPVDRNEIIPIYQKHTYATPELKLVFVDQKAQEPGDGTFEKPFANLRVARSVPNDGIIVFSKDKKDEDLEKEDEKVFVLPPPPKYVAVQPSKETEDSKSDKEARKKGKEEPLKDEEEEIKGGYITKRLRKYAQDLGKEWNDMWK